MGEERPPIAVPFRLREAFIVPTGWPPDVLPNQLIASAHINIIRSSVYAWPGDVDAQNHKLKNVILEGVTGVITDPTTTKGDLIARGASALGRLAVGANNQILTADSSAASGMKWAALPVVGVSSIFGRAGVVTAQAGDYTAAMVTGAVSTSGSYSDPAWLTAFAWAKLTGVPPVFPAAAHQHAASDIVSGVFSTARMGSGIADGTVFLRGDGTWSVPGGPGGVVPTARLVSAGYGLTGGGSLAADITLAGVDNTMIQKVRVLAAGVLVAARWGVNLVQGSNVTISAVDDIANDRVNITIASAGGGGTGGAVDSVFGRTGAILAQTGDYHVSQVTNALADMTTSKGDLLARTTSALARLPVGTDGQVLTADNAQPMGVKWAAAGAAAGVASFNTRTGAVMPVAGDYTAAMVTGAVVNPTSAKGDLMVRDVSVVQRLALGSDGFVLTADSAQALGVRWAAVAAGASQTPWTQDIQAAGFRLLNTGNVGIGTASPQRSLHAAAANFTELVLESTSVINGPDTGRCWGFLNEGGALVMRTVDAAFTDSRTRVTITSAGNVGIGNTAVAAPSAGTLTHLIVGPTSGSVYGMATVCGNVTATDSAVGGFNFANYALAGTEKRIANIACFLDGAADSGRLGFYTWHLGAVGERMRISAAGNVGIGTASPASNNRLTVSSDAPGIAGTIASSQMVITGAEGPATVGSRCLWLGMDTATNVGVIQPGIYGVGWNNLLLNPAGGNVGIGTASPDSHLSFGGFAADINSRIALFESTGTGSLNFRGIGMANLSAGVYGVGIYAGSAAPTNTNMTLFIQDGGVIKMLLGGSLKTLSVDGSGFVKAA